MWTARPLPLVIILLVLFGAGPTLSGLLHEPTNDTAEPRPPRSVSLRPDVEVTGADADQRARVDAALKRFRAAGLSLPDLEIHFHPDVDACQGHLGLYQNWYEPPRVLVCSELDFVVTHELAHAWEATNVSDADRDRFAEAQGLTTWDDPAVPWAERGREAAAFIVQQNLMVASPSPPSAVWQERLIAYEQLTGKASPAQPATSPQ